MTKQTETVKIVPAPVAETGKTVDAVKDSGRVRVGNGMLRF